MCEAALLFARIAANDSTSANRGDVLTHVLCVDTSAETSLDDVLWDAPERGKDVECTTVFAVERADKERRLAI